MGQVSVKFILPYEGFYGFFYYVLSLDIRKRWPFVLNVMFIQMISDSKVAFNSFCASKLKYNVGIKITW